MLGGLTRRKTACWIDTVQQPGAQANAFMTCQARTPSSVLRLTEGRARRFCRCYRKVSSQTADVVLPCLAAQVHDVRRLGNQDGSWLPDGVEIINQNVRKIINACSLDWRRPGNHHRRPGPGDLCRSVGGALHEGIVIGRR
jgi:hypothetical protein